ncbi:MAG: type II secretion system protein M [Steroidobacteraceae bacterium]
MNVQQWIRGLAPRERRLVLAAAGVGFIALLYLGVALPVQRMQTRQAARVEQKTADLAWMRQAAPRVAAVAARGGGNESLVVLVDRTGRAAGIGSAVRDSSPDGANGLRLRIEGAPFDATIEWLGTLQQQYGVTVSDATIDAAGTPGLVNASITLSHGGTRAAP